MDKACDVLANTGSNTPVLLVMSLLVIAVALSLVVLVNRKHGSKYKIFGGGASVLVLVFALGLSVFMSYPGSANAAGLPTDCSKNISSITDPNALILVNDAYDSHSGLNHDSMSNEWYGSFNIMANDHAPAGDPIDPTTIRLSGSPTQYRDIGPGYDEPAGTDFSILNPSDPNGPEWGGMYVDGAYDINNNYVVNGNLYVYLYNTVPDGTVFTLHYTAKTMSGKDASNTATVTVTVPLQPALVDDPYTLGTNGGGVLPVIDNDRPLSGDPFNATTLEIMDPSNNSEYLNSTYASISGEYIASDSSAAVYWQVVNGKIVVTFGPDVPFDTPITTKYRVTSVNGLIPSRDGVITVTRSSTAPANPVQVSDFYLMNGGTCVTNDGFTASLLDNVSTSIGSIDPLSIDLDPFTPGKQTSLADKAGNIITVDSGGNLTYTGNATVQDDIIYFTVANTNGDVSNIGRIFINGSSHFCGG